MLFNSKINQEAIKASKYLNKLMAKDAKIEILEKRALRSNSQNRYLHLLLGKYSIWYGNTIDETKEDIKRTLGYVYEKNGNIYYQHTSKMDSKELTLFIERFRKYSEKNGLYLPEPWEEERLFAIEQELENNKEWL